MSGSRSTSEILRVEGLRVRYPGAPSDQHAVEDVSFTVHCGEVVGLVGASGSGKSSVLGAVARLLPHGTEVGARRLDFDGVSIPGLTPARLREVRGRGLGMIFQDPRAALNPVMRVGDQVAEAARVQRGLGRRAAWRLAVAKLARVGLPRPETTARAYPHMLSGGMCQRVLIAMALVGEPRLLLADEPTTALDVTTQAGILGLIRSLRAETGMAVLLVTHDLRVVADMADRAVVMERGKVVETATAHGLLAAPCQEATRRLVRALPRLGARKGPISRAQATESSAPSGVRIGGAYG